MSHAARATRFLAEGRRELVNPEGPCEGSEESEERVGPDPPDDEWTALTRAAYAPVLHLPPEGCLGPRACARLGPCPRHAAGAPCEVVS